MGAEHGKTQHSKETLSFNSFTGYYGSMPAGYGGFNYVSMQYLNATYWESIETNWCDTGYQNVDHGAGEAVAIQGYSIFETLNVKETFSLKSMVAASAWETHQPFTFASYTYSEKQKYWVLKASVTVYLSQTAKTINFAKLGKQGDFANIGLLLMKAGSGSYGNTCSYGKYSYTTGVQLAFDNLKAVWNGKIPHPQGGKPTTNGLNLHHHHHASQFAAHLAGNGHHTYAAAGNADPSDHHHAADLYHSQLLMLPGHDPGGLTAQFSLPAVDHHLGT